MFQFLWALVEKRRFFLFFKIAWENNSVISSLLLPKLVSNHQGCLTFFISKVYTYFFFFKKDFDDFIVTHNHIKLSLIRFYCSSKSVIFSGFLMKITLLLSNSATNFFWKIKKSFSLEKFAIIKVFMHFLLVYNYQRPLKALKFKTPYEKVIEEYEINPSLFFINSNQKKLGLIPIPIFN